MVHTTPLANISKKFQFGSLVESLDITTRDGLFAIYTVFSAEIASHVTLVLKFDVDGAICQLVWVILTFDVTLFFDLTGIQVQQQ